VVYEKDGQTSSLKAETIIWTTGVSGSPVVGESNLQERRGRVVVTDNLTDPNFDDLYILGDVAAVMDKESGRPYPTTAQIATEMAVYAAKDLESQINGNGHLSTPFVYKSKGTVASVGNTHGFGVIGKLEVKGYPASMMKKMIMNKSLFEIGGFKEFIAKGRFDLYH
jgi:NADH dehydrogenase